MMTEPAHEILPEPGTVRRERDGAPGDVRDPVDYPLTAACMTCGRPVRCAGWLLDEWTHILPAE